MRRPSDFYSAALLTSVPPSAGTHVQPFGRRDHGGTPCHRPGPLTPPGGENSSIPKRRAVGLGACLTRRGAAPRTQVQPLRSGQHSSSEDLIGACRALRDRRQVTRAPAARYGSTTLNAPNRSRRQPAVDHLVDPQPVSAERGGNIGRSGHRSYEVCPASGNRMGRPLRPEIAALPPTILPTVGRSGTANPGRLAEVA